MIVERLPFVERLGCGAKDGGTETYGTVTAVTETVGTAVRDSLEHAHEQCGVGWTTVEVIDSGETTHEEMRVTQRRKPLLRKQALQPTDRAVPNSTRLEVYRYSARVIIRPGQTFVNWLGDAYPTPLFVLFA
jgi:hypothetical protein